MGRTAEGGTAPVMAAEAAGDVDQVVRLAAYKAAHPEVEITFIGPHWQAVIPGEGDSKTVICRYDLKWLLDKLEPPGEPGGMGADPPPP